MFRLLAYTTKFVCLWKQTKYWKVENWIKCQVNVVVKNCIMSRMEWITKLFKAIFSKLLRCYQAFLRLSSIVIHLKWNMNDYVNPSSVVRIYLHLLSLCCKTLETLLDYFKSDIFKFGCEGSQSIKKWQIIIPTEQLLHRIHNFEWLDSSKMS